MSKFKKEDKAFRIPNETWYCATKMENDYIMIGFYPKEGGTDGEFKIEWNEFGIYLKAYHDSWDALLHMPDLIELMAKIDKNRLNPSIHTFAKMLKELGYRDITERERL